MIEKLLHKGIRLNVSRPIFDLTVIVKTGPALPINFICKSLLLISMSVH